MEERRRGSRKKKKKKKKKMISNIKVFEILYYGYAYNTF